jgi:hypothetical protein
LRLLLQQQVLGLLFCFLLMAAGTANLLELLP